MAVYIYREPQFRKWLEELKKGGGKAALVSERAEKLIRAYASKNRMLPQSTKTMTKYGEARIPNSRKFNLGAGYRLICMRKFEDIVFLCVGPHDFCNCWIDNNRGLDPDIQNDCLLVEPRPVADNEGSLERPEPETDYDRLLMSRIDERTLRKIFCGLNRY
ncbi:MAG: hypothetical protein COZ70_09295 [Deltaproteobacteria bacterium CG_4_8_14_3_um_filter_51_11]|nr:hypothetical protein [bacterium]OIP37477.1 MAG: hypothetical protein AUK25_14835 [Desulfobacteraceae bacterium CG2_30_51_40]PIP48534.1 MAG: hypothetical protein COX16_00840 [Deltaproteobacteria bacterium CG23_combo_of_CG06-09_8_20_14_all_51_20]PIX19390.1 MAG: hypothetical protein COZ70_09295 [Deltaproteobacteria bacterium CG_4_8_14_3_um_filter_51_11]PIY21649.1 MAG: hypothetical protein COZ11_15620 [Deltaproteobacteria bacterium CG_4_10_14_3_um_filter_51_14]PJB37698.1 MAG: hypothetical prote